MAFYPILKSTLSVDAVCSAMRYCRSDVRITTRGPQRRAGDSRGALSQAHYSVLLLLLVLIPLSHLSTELR